MSAVIVKKMFYSSLIDKTLNQNLSHAVSYSAVNANY